MASKEDKKDLWLSWTHDAAGIYVRPDDLEDDDDGVEDAVEFATRYADAMLEEFEDRFEQTAGTRRRRKGARSRDNDAET